MAKNVVQFQKGLSEAAFRSQYGTEEQCRAALFSWRWPRGFVCPKCAGTHSIVLRTRPIQQCSTCRHQVSLIAGTIFHATKLPLTTWFAALYHLTQSKNGLSSLELARRLGVSHYTAWKIQHKLMQVMLERDQDKPLTGERIEVDDAYIGGERSGGKRGRGSAGKTPFVAAVETTAEGKPVRVKFSRVANFRRVSIKGWAVRHLRPAGPVYSDGLNAFRGISYPAAVRKRTARGTMPGAVIGRSSRGPARRRSGPPPSSGPTPCSATSRPVWPAPSTPSATSTSRVISPNSNTASTAATIWPP
jgi:hypothetical protein